MHRATAWMSVLLVSLCAYVLRADDAPFTPPPSTPIFDEPPTGQEPSDPPPNDPPNDPPPLDPWVTILPPGTYGDFAFPIVSGTPEQPNIYDGQNQVIIDFGQPTFYIDALGKTKFFYPDSDGNWRVNASYVTFRNIIVRGGGTGLQGENAATRVMNGKRGVYFVGCTFEQSIGCGVSINDTFDSGIVSCTIQDNGQIGYAFSRTTNAVIRGNLIRRNNPGFSFDPKFIVNKVVQTTQVGSKWYVKPGFESGSSKGSRTIGAIIEFNEGYENVGPGIVWLDIDNVNAIVRNNHAHHNKRLGDNGGQGIFVELNRAPGTFVIENNYVHDNDGAGIAVAETFNVRVANNRFENDEMILRDIAGRNSPLRNVEIVNNSFTNSSIETRQGTWNSGTTALKSIAIYDNTFQTTFRVKWGNKTYTKLPQAQTVVGQPIGSIVP